MNALNGNFDFYGSLYSYTELNLQKTREYKNCPQFEKCADVAPAALASSLAARGAPAALRACEAQLASGSLSAGGHLGGISLPRPSTWPGGEGHACWS